MLLGLKVLSKLCLYLYEERVYLVRDSPEPINKAATQIVCLCLKQLLHFHPLFCLFYPKADKKDKKLIREKNRHF